MTRSCFVSVSRRCLAAALLLVILVLSGCTLTLLSGPVTVTAGDVVTYVLQLQNQDWDGSNVELWLTAEVPDSWDLLSNSYTGTANGLPVSGSATPTLTPGPYTLGTVHTGMKQLWLKAGPFAQILSTDQATLTLQFDASSVPAGEFYLYFKASFTNSDKSSGSGSSNVAYVSVNRQRSFLELVGALFDGESGVDGLANGVAISSSADRKHVYVVAEGDSAVASFERSGPQGQLTQVDLDVDGDPGGVDGLLSAGHGVLSPDGAHLYTTSYFENAVAVFARDAGSGQLTFVEALFDGQGGVDGLIGAEAVTVSPDGNHVYVVSHSYGALVVFSRNQTTGQLTFVEAELNGVGGITDLGGATDVAVSPDGNHVYVAGSWNAAVLTFSREASSGEVTYVEAIIDDEVLALYGAQRVLVSEDGKQVYVGAAESGGAVNVFSRDATTGLLTFVEAEVEGGDNHGLIGLVDLDLGCGQRHLFTAGSRGLAHFQRNPADGSLTFAEAYLDGTNDLEWIDSARAVSVSPDCLNVYVTGAADASLVTFRQRPLFADGFESGDPSQWSATAP